MSEKKNIKVILLGDGKVGKTSITNQFMSGTFAANLDRTAQAKQNTKDIKVCNMNVRLNIWDTAGQEDFAS